MTHTDSPRQRRHARTRQEILTAAMELVVEKGIDNLSMREIARRVDYSPAGLYEYFVGKDDLLAALAADGFQRLSNLMASIQEESSPQEQIVELGMAYVTFAHQYPEYFQLIFTRMTSLRRSLDGPSKDSPYTVLMQAVAEFIEAGDFPFHADLNVEMITYNLWSMMHGMAMLQTTHLKNFEADFPTADRMAIRAFLNGLSTT